MFYDKSGLVNHPFSQKGGKPISQKAYKIQT